MKKKLQIVLILLLVFSFTKVYATCEDEELNTFASDLKIEYKDYSKYGITNEKGEQVWTGELPYAYLLAFSETRDDIYAKAINNFDNDTIDGRMIPGYNIYAVGCQNNLTEVVYTVNVFASENSACPNELLKTENPNPIKDPQSSTSSSCNFERLFSEIIEAQSDIESMDEGVKKFFSNYIENIVNPNEMKNTIKIIKQNESNQSKLIEDFKTFLETELHSNKEKVEKDMKITKQIETKTYQVARAKDMFRELNEMLHGDIISHQKEIKKYQKRIRKFKLKFKLLKKKSKSLIQKIKSHIMKNLICWIL